MTEPRVGDTPRTDKSPALVDTSGEQQIEPQGDTRKPGYVSEPLTSPAPDVKGPTGDTIRTAKEPALVEHYETAQSDKTPNEVFGATPKAKAIDSSPQNKAVAARSTK